MNTKREMKQIVSLSKQQRYILDLMRNGGKRSMVLKLRYIGNKKYKDELAKKLQVTPPTI